MKVHYAWAACLAAMYAVIVVSGHSMSDPDSTLYAAIAGQMAEAPIEGWLAPTWPEGRSRTGPFLEHLPVFFWPSALLEKAGLPQASLLANLLYYLAGLWVLFRLAGESRAAGWAAVFLFAFSPAGLQYVLRANHETAWALGTIGLLWALDRSPKTAPLFAVIAFGAKGALGLLAFPMAAAWRWRIDRRLAICLGTVVLAAGLLEGAHRAATGGVPFLPRHFAAQAGNLAAFEAGRLWEKLVGPPYYAVQILWFALPGSILAFVRPTPVGRKAGGAVGAAILCVSLMSKRAARYVFPVFPVAALAGAMAAVARWPKLAAFIEARERRWPYVLMIALAVALIARLWIAANYRQFINPFS